MPSRWKKLVLGGLLAGAASLWVGAGPARAEIRLSLEAGSPTMEGSNFRWTYDVFLRPASELDSAGGGRNPGNFVTLYDVNGLVPNSVVLSGDVMARFTSSVQNTGLTPPGI